VKPASAEVISAFLNSAASRPLQAKCAAVFLIFSETHNEGVQQSIAETIIEQLGR
jgi:hypothetical protein